MSLDVVDNVESTKSESFFKLDSRFSRSTKLSLLVCRVAVPIWDTCHELTVLIRIRDLIESTWTVQFLYDLCVPRNNWWTCGPQVRSLPFQWKSLMRLFDIHPPSDVSVDRSFSESPRSAVSQKTPLAMSNANSSQRDFKSGPWKKSLETPHTEYAPLGEI